MIGVASFDYFVVFFIFAEKFNFPILNFNDSDGKRIFIITTKIELKGLKSQLPVYNFKNKNWI